jgi:nicotinamide-nucleotide amidase
MDIKKISILTVGDEILIGQIVDTNSAWLGEKLSSLGIIPQSVISIGDNREKILETLSFLMEQNDLVIMTGGLGPTKDDITVKCIADFMDVPLVFNEKVYERICVIFEKLQRPLSPSHKQQCYLPEGVEILHNSMGTAPGMLCKIKNTLLISLPGVPYEMKAIMEEEVIPGIIKPALQENIIQETFVVVGKGETEIEDSLKDVIQQMPDYFSVAYLPGLGQVRIRLTARGNADSELLERKFNEFSEKISSVLGLNLIGKGDTNLETVIGIYCQNFSLKTGTLESCTGGRIGARIASVSGASAYYNGGIIAYNNEIKNRIIGVPENTLNTYGAVSEETVRSMVENGLKVMDVDVALAISGIAGPSGGSLEKPVGTVWIAVGNSSKVETKMLTFGKKREQNIVLSTQAALNMLRLFILKNYEKDTAKG